LGTHFAEKRGTLVSTLTVMVFTAQGYAVLCWTDEEDRKAGSKMFTEPTSMHGVGLEMRSTETTTLGLSSEDTGLLVAVKFIVRKKYGPEPLRSVLSVTIINDKESLKDGPAHVLFTATFAPSLFAVTISVFWPSENPRMPLIVILGRIRFAIALPQVPSRGTLLRKLTIMVLAAHGTSELCVIDTAMQVGCV
jgi:hypothetical protein